MSASNRDFFGPRLLCSILVAVAIAALAGLAAAYVSTRF